MPIRLLFLLIFLPSTFLSSLNVSHVDALILYEPKPVGWNNRLFKGSQERAHLVRLLYNLEHSSSPYKVAWSELEGETSALFPLPPLTGRNSEEKQTNQVPEQRFSYHAPTQSSEMEHSVFALQRRRISPDQSAKDSTITVTQISPSNARKEPSQQNSNSFQETDANSNESRKVADEDRTSTSTSANETFSSTIPTKPSAVKATKSSKVDKKSNAELLDAGMKGAIVIGVGSLLLGLLLLFRRIYLSKTTEDRRTDAAISNRTVHYAEGFHISGPLGNGKDRNRSLKMDDSASANQKNAKIEGVSRSKSQAIHPAARRALANTVSLPSAVKITKERTRLTASKQGK